VLSGVTRRHQSVGTSTGVLLLLLVSVLCLLSACTERRDRASPNTAVRVNREEVTVQHLAYLLNQQRGLKAEQSEAVGRQLLERLIDQQLMLQKADDLKLERDPRVAIQLEMARRELLARAYMDKLGEGIDKATPEEIAATYAAKASLFGQRRIYHFKEITVEARPEQFEAVRSQLAAARDAEDFVSRIQRDGFRSGLSESHRGPEQLPLSSVDSFARMTPGQAAVLPSPAGLQVVFLVATQAAPLTEEQARPTIEQFIQNDRVRKRVEDDLKGLRAAARIEYAPKFAPVRGSANGAASAAAPAAPAAAGSAPVAAAAAAAAVSTVPAASAASAPSLAGSAAR
jgi:EpsD family peptidyl-prolyl cis-trans isomerase